MRRFAQLYEALDTTTSTNAKVEAMGDYFASVPAEDAAWGLFFLTGRRLKRHFSARLLADWSLELTGLPGWIFEECYAQVGDLAETAALLVEGSLESAPALDLPLSRWMDEHLIPLRELTPEAQREAVLGWWRALPRAEVYLLNKLLTGELRVGVSQTLVIRALARHAGLEPADVTHRLMGTWSPSAELFRRVVSREKGAADRSRPYPFYLASPLEDPPESLGSPADWQIEWKWDGIRGQLVKRGEIFLWSRGEELITDRFPEILDAARALPDGVVLDGEVLAMRGGEPLPFSVLQRRIGRHKLSAKILEDAPAGFMAYDLLELGGEDLREQPLRERRAKLEALLGELQGFAVSPIVTGADWASLAERREESRARGVEGFMIKHLEGPYRTGRRRGEWWKWKIDPYAIDAVLVYAQPGNGRRSNLYTDYTFGVWQEGELLPIAKAYSGLSDEEIREMDRWIRSHTTQKFGPVRAVEPTQVFELHFEAIAPSSRHKSGIAVRFPRIARRRTDKKAEEADTLEQVKRLISAGGDEHASPEPEPAST